MYVWRWQFRVHIQTLDLHDRQLLGEAGVNASFVILTGIEREKTTGALAFVPACLQGCLIYKTVNTGDIYIVYVGGTFQIWSAADGHGKERERN